MAVASRIFVVRSGNAAGIGTFFLYLLTRSVKLPPFQLLHTFVVLNIVLRADIVKQMVAFSAASAPILNTVSNTSVPRVLIIVSMLAMANTDFVLCPNSGSQSQRGLVAPMGGRN